MTVGVLLFAFNNHDIDYVEMAAWCAHHIKRHLLLPVAVVTDSPKANDYCIFDQVIQQDLSWDGGQRFFEDIDKTVPWYNANRVDAYDLTPWDRTLVIDTDFVINSNSLLPYIKSNKNFMCYRWASNITSDSQRDWELNYFGRNKFPQWWATVMIFDKTPYSKMIFDSMKMVKKHWPHYRHLYGIQRSQFRNDYALSISLGIVSGHTLITDDILGSLPTLTPNVRLERLDKDNYQISWYDDKKKLRYSVLKGFDFHAMGKGHLGDVIAKDKAQGLFDSGVQH